MILLFRVTAVYGIRVRRLLRKRQANGAFVGENVDVVTSARGAVEHTEGGGAAGAFVRRIHQEESKSLLHGHCLFETTSTRTTPSASKAANATATCTLLRACRR